MPAICDKIQDAAVDAENSAAFPPWYWNCPFCGASSSFRVIAVNDDHYLRKCISCRKGNVYPLGPLKKRIIYLDQNVLSEMMKALKDCRQRRQTRPTATFYLELFNKLDQLGKLMLLVCPSSVIHDVESKGFIKLVDQDAGQQSATGRKMRFEEEFEEVRRLFTHLSCGTAFHRPSVTNERQILAALKLWIKDGDAFVPANDPSEAIKGKINVWLPTVYPAADSCVQLDEVSDLEWVKNEQSKRFDRVVDRWRKEKTNRFQDWFEQEITGHGLALLDAYRQHEPSIKSIRARLGMNRFCYPRSSQANTMMRILEALEDAGFIAEQGIPKAKEFFVSTVFRQIPFVRIGSAVWAGLANNVSRGGWSQKAKYPSANDVRYISAYLPYCDAMFTDNACACILKDKLVSQSVPENKKVFSAKTKDDFMKFLDSIEAAATPNHRAKVREVYGDGWVSSSIECSPTDNQRKTLLSKVT